MTPRGSQVSDDVAQLRAELAAREREAADKELQLERYAADLRETFKRLQRSYKATVQALSNAVERRDAYLGKHAERVTAYGLEVARVYGFSLQAHPEVEFGFLLHDIGKVKIPDEILFKRDALSDSEREVIERHPVIGAELVEGIDFLKGAVDVIRSHHERWDGSGYPDQLEGEAIPLAARLFAVADALDAITTDRPYHPAEPLAAARRTIIEASGSHFDPAVVEAFETIPDETLLRIAAEIG